MNENKDIAIPEKNNENKDNFPNPSDINLQNSKLPPNPFIHAIWALTLVAVIAIAAFWIYPIEKGTDEFEKGVKGVGSVFTQGLNALTQAIKPSINVQDVMSQTLGEIDRTKKLVVYTQSVDIELTREKENRWFSDYLPAGSTAVRLKVLGNKVQFYVPLEQINEDCFSYNSRTQILSINCPKVRMDKDMVSVQSDPAKMIIEEKSSWVPFGPKASDLLKDAQSELKNQVILTANHELVWNSAKIEAEKAMQEFFGSLKSAMKEGSNIQIMLP